MNRYELGSAVQDFHRARRQAALQELLGRLTGLVVAERGLVLEEVLERARAYLEAHQVGAAFVQEEEPVPPAMLRTAADHDNDLIVIGGWGRGSVLEAVLGSTVDDLLRASPQPLLICQ